MQLLTNKHELAVREIERQTTNPKKMISADYARMQLKLERKEISFYENFVEELKSKIFERCGKSFTETIYNQGEKNFINPLPALGKDVSSKKIQKALEQQKLYYAVNCGITTIDDHFTYATVCSAKPKDGDYATNCLLKIHQLIDTINLFAEQEKELENITQLHSTKLSKQKNLIKEQKDKMVETNVNLELARETTKLACDNGR